MTAEGFGITVPDLQTVIQGLVVPPSTPEASVTSVIEFPKLDAPEQKAAALKLVKQPEPEP